jgi:hypothetical protein
MSKQLKVEENLEGQLGNLALQDNEVKPIDQQSGAGAQESSSKVSSFYFTVSWYFCSWTRLWVA